ncbi:MAG: hypothetical protein FJ121_01685 [Deltaproteobacteria bacterium]|nr:hypothetical protein [Deltaproteobacteria bacterium]
MARRSNEFQTIRSEGGLLPPDLLRHVLDPKEKLPGTGPEDYGLPPGERLNEVITQSWNRLRKHWAEFQATSASLSEGEVGTGLTNDKWNLPLLRELAFGMLPTTAGPEIGGRTYAISRFFGPVPVHLLGCGLSLDRKAAGVRGAAAVNPHGLVQEFLNRSPRHLWAIVSNGLTFRILRDNQALSRQSFLEFDLAAMFSGEVYSDFVLFWLMAHATRFAPREGDRPETCWLEQWTKLAEEQGTRALGDLRQGVEQALRILGEGFTSHSKNLALRERLRSGETSLTDFHGQLLRVVYRLIFLFVAEDRTIEGLALLHPRDGSEAARLARERYAAHYSTGRLRDLASHIKGSRHSDLWRQFQLLVGALSGDANFAAVREHLALPILGSFLWDPNSTAVLNDAELTNFDFLEALRHLAFTRQGKVLRPVDYKNLGAEELGGVYESLLALTPQISADGARFTFAEFAGSERKTSGSYYTPDSLVQCLLDSALDPVVEEAIKGKTGPEAEKAIRSLKVCDPAVGSGHFLVGSAHRLARHLARVRALAQGESEPSPLLYQQALRDVIGRCLYGVDLNPMSAELCRVNLWLEALEPGKPLSFLDHHIRVGNSLLGATPDIIAAGLPDDAFKPIEGDDKKACAVLKKRNKAERKGWGPLFARQDAETQDRLINAAAALEEMPDDRPENIRARELAFRRHEQTEEYRHKKQLYDTWCAAFVIKKHFSEPGRESSTSGITQGYLNDLAAGRPLPAELTSEVERLIHQYQFFHWHLAFPEVFAKGGFDCVMGNPPWERVKLQEKEWFAEREPEIATAKTAAERKRMIRELKSRDTHLIREFVLAQRQAEGESHFLRNSGDFPLCARGDINLFAVFAEQMRKRISLSGRLGCLMPSGIATDDTTKAFFQSLVRETMIRRVLDFENTKGLFPTVDRNTKFCLLTIGRPCGSESSSTTVACGLQDVAEVSVVGRTFELRTKDILLLNPNTRTCPLFRSFKDAELVIGIYRRLPILLSDVDDISSGWNPTFMTMFHMANDSDLFIDNAALRASELETGQHYLTALVPLYEGKMIYHFDHRFASSTEARGGQKLRGGSEETTASQHADAGYVPESRYSVLRTNIPQLVTACRGVLAYRRVGGTVANIRTMMASIVPQVGIGDSLFMISLPLAERSLGLCGVLNSFAFDYVLRSKMSGINLNFYIIKQIPVPAFPLLKSKIPWNGSGISLIEWLTLRTIELTYTAWDLEPFAQDCGWSGPPFRWEEERRFLLRCELDAAFFHLYLPATADGQWKLARVAEGAVRDETPEEMAELTGHFPTPRDAVAYIMDTFPIVRRKDEEKYDGDYRTKRIILEIYDAMAAAIRTGQPYQTRLDPPPGPPEGGLPEWQPGQPQPPDWPPHIHPPKGVSDAD